ncbi:MAG: BACON domain-containing protein [Bacteroidales bacterium]|nr:BACON domain-containing protein [Bacteroidales bacterium]
MKRLVTTILLCCVCAVIGLCGINKTLNAAQRLYQSATTIKNYQDAKNKFISARKDVGYVAAEHEKAIKEGVRKCDRKISELSPRLTVNGSSTSTDVSFSASGGSKTLTISTNKGTPYASSLPSWITVSGSSSSHMTIYCSENTSTSSRSDWFNVNAGNKSVRVNVSQSAGREAHLTITGASFGNTKKDGTIINDFGATLYASDIRYLCPKLTYNGPATSQTKTIYVKIFGPNGVLELGSSSKDVGTYTYSQNITFYPGMSNTVKISGWGNEKSSSYSSGTYRFEFYWDGSEQYSASLYLHKRAGESGYLTVDNKTSVSASFGASRSSETFYVQTDADSWSTWGVPSWCTITEKTSTSFKIVCDANTTSYPRSDYMKIKAGDKEVRIDITQAAGQVSSATINRIWVDHNTYNWGQIGMTIHIDFSVNGLKNHSICPVAYFYYSNGNKLNDYDGLYRTTEGQVAIEGDKSNADYDGTRWSDYTLFMPYAQLHMAPGSYILQFQIYIKDKTTDKFLVGPESQNFTFSR